MGVDSKLKIQEMPILDAYEKKLKESRYNEYDTQVVETSKELETLYSQLKIIERPVELERPEDLLSLKLVREQEDFRQKLKHLNTSSKIGKT